MSPEEKLEQCPSKTTGTRSKSNDANNKRENKQHKTKVPVRGGSVKVRTKREKRTKLPLSAFGNIYPPFIVTPLFRNFSKMYRRSYKHRNLRRLLSRPILHTDRAHVVFSSLPFRSFCADYAVKSRKRWREERKKIGE